MRNAFASWFAFVQRHKLLLIWPIAVFLILLLALVALSWGPTAAVSIYRV